jgi:hypothetical protein
MLRFLKWWAILHASLSKVVGDCLPASTAASARATPSTAASIVFHHRSPVQPLWFLCKIDCSWAVSHDALCKILDDHLFGRLRHTSSLHVGRFLWRQRKIVCRFFWESFSKQEAVLFMSRVDSLPLKVISLLVKEQHSSFEAKIHGTNTQVNSL